MKAVSDFFTARPKLAVVVAFLLSVSGVVGVLSARVRLYPTVAEPTITISCTYPGANSREVMNTVAGPIEDQINGVEGMLYMTSSCADSGAYSCTVAFEIGTDRDVALMKVQTLVQQALSMLPQEVKNTGLTVKAGTPEDFAILTLRSPGGRLSFQEISDYVFGVIQPAVLRVQGVGDATVRSDKIAMRIWFDPKRMAALGVSPDEAVDAIRRQNIQASIGSVGATPTGDPNGRVISLIAQGRLKGVGQFEDIIIRTNADGGLVRLRDIARIELGHQAYNYQSYQDGVPAVQVLISLFPGEDLKRTHAMLAKTMRELQRDFPEDLVWEMTYDATDFMSACFAELGKCAGLGLLALSLVLFVFLRDLKSVLVLLSSIGLSVAPAFAVISAFGESVNLLTLIAAFLAIGIALFDALALLKGASPNSICVSTLVMVAAFVPMGFIQGLTGAVYRQFAIVLATAAVFSALVGLTVLPVARDRYVRRERTIRMSLYLERMALWLVVRPAVTLALVAFVTLAFLAIFRAIPSTVVPDEDTGRINLNVETPECTRMPMTAETVRRAAEAIRSIDGVSTVLSLCGNSSTGGAGENQALVTVMLEDWGKRAGRGADDRAITQKIAELNAAFPLAAFYPLPPSTLPGLGGSVQLFIMSTSDDDPIRLAEEAHRLKRIIGLSSLVERAVCGYTATTPHLRINVDRAKCELVKVPLSTLYSTLQNYLGSLYVNDINLGTQVNRVTVQADWDARAGQEAVKDIFVCSLTGAMVPIGSLVTFEEELGPRVCYRYNKYVYCAITVVPAVGVSSREVIDECVRILDGNLPHGFAYAWGNLTFHEMRGVGNTGLMAMVAMMLVYLILVGRFNSWRGPLVTVLPVAGVAATVAAGLCLTDAVMSIHSQVAVLVFALLAIKSAVLQMEADEPLRAVSANFVAMVAVAACDLVLPFSSGAGRCTLQAVGAAAFFGAIGVALFVPVLVPGLCSLISRGRR